MSGPCIASTFSASRAMWQSFGGTRATRTGDLPCVLACIGIRFPYLQTLCRGSSTTSSCVSEVWTPLTAERFLISYVPWTQLSPDTWIIMDWQRRLFPSRVRGHAWCQNVSGLGLRTVPGAAVIGGPPCSLNVWLSLCRRYVRPEARYVSGDFRSDWLSTGPSRHW